MTGEAVALELRPAAVPSRLLAAALDALLQLVLLVAVLVLVAAVSPSISSAAAGALMIVLLLLVSAGYPVAFESLLRGRTPGKMALGLRVVRDDGGPIGFRQAFVRGLAGTFIERPGVTLYAGGIITMLLNGQGKRIGDLLAGTVVLQERVAVRGGQVAMMPPQLAGWAATTDLSGLQDELALSVRQFMARSGELTVAARNDLGGRLVAAVLAAVSPPPPPGTPGWALLSAVLAERRRREEARLGTPPGPPAVAWGMAAPPSHAPPPSYAAPSYAAPSYAPPASYAPSPPASLDDPPTSPGPGGFVAPS
ncbi:MAG: domain containing protein [Frankiales bacterium]|nr:domain containing protein [Frankiales bacterium]